MFLHFRPRFSGTEVFLSTTSLMSGFYPWLLNTGGPAQEALSPLKSPLSSLSLTRAAGASIAHGPPWPKLARDQAAAALHQGTGARAERRRAGSCRAPLHVSSSQEAVPTLPHSQRHGGKQDGGEAKLLKPCLCLLASIALCIN